MDMSPKQQKQTNQIPFFEERVQHEYKKLKNGDIPRDDEMIKKITQCLENIENPDGVPEPKRQEIRSHIVENLIYVEAQRQWMEEILDLIPDDLPPCNNY